MTGNAEYHCHPWSAALQRVLAVGLLYVLIIVTLDYPVGGYFLLAALLCHIAILLYHPYFWLFLVPIIIPLFNLAPWSGRLLFEEFDLFLLATLIGGLGGARYRVGSFFRQSKILLWLIAFLSLSYGISLARGMMVLTPLDFDALATYESNYNSLRIGRGFFWVLLLSPLLLQALTEAGKEAGNLLIKGIVTGLIGNGLVILWERGALADLIHFNNIYAAFGNLLDFSTTYRVTGLFSEMHTGGAALDGYLILAWPFTLSAIILFRQRMMLLGWGSAAFMLAIYSIVTTFTRITYAALFFSAFVFVITIWLKRPKTVPIKVGIGIFLLLLISMVAFTYGFTKGGMLAVLACATAVLTGIMAGIGQRWLSFPKMAAFSTISVMMLLYVLSRAILASKWVQTPLVDALFISVSLIGVLHLSGWKASTEALQFINRRDLVILVGIAVLGSVIAVVALFNYRMEARFTTVSQDANTRIDHWQTTLAAMYPEWSVRMFGMGLGSFPRNYLMTHLQARKTAGNYSFHQVAGENYLSLGLGGQLGLGQRVTLQSDRIYLLELDARSDSAGSLQISVCRRNILYSEGWQGSGCQYASAPIKPSPTWEKIKVNINVDTVSRGQWYERWPVVFMLHNGGSSIIDLDNISLMDGTGRDHLVNGNFERGGDHWFSYIDFNHLPWHVKNLWLNIYFDQGIIGVIAFTLIILYAGLHTNKLVKQGSSLALAILAALLGFMVMGFAESPLDAPRIMFFFYLILFCGILYRCETPNRK
jgi:hypothetical protein